MYSRVKIYCRGYMGSKSEEYLALYRLTNTRTSEVVEARGLRNLLKSAGLSINTPQNQLRKSKKWLIEQIDEPLLWDENSYRRGLYIRTKDRYKEYEARKRMRDPLFERRKRGRLVGWKNKDGTPFTAEQHDHMLLCSCEVCGSDVGIGVDHHHSSGVVRGTLCRSCNLAIGHAADSPLRLLQLVDYLNKHGVFNNAKD